MQNRKLDALALRAFAQQLRAEGRAPGTIEKYLRDARAFGVWLDGTAVDAARASGWREHLLSQGYAPVTVNAMLSSVNTLFRLLGWQGVRVRFVKIQRRIFREPARELTRAEYEKLLSAALTRGQERLALLMQTICSTGIRVSELRYITLEAVRTGVAQIALKGKVRTILLPVKLCRKLTKYAQKQKIASGEIFLTGSGSSLSRKQIWAEMKRLCQCAGVAPGKVFPHNLRHLFATTFYNACRDIAKLADVLGHSSIETTRIYLMQTGEEHRRQLERLRLVR